MGICPKCNGEMKFVEGGISKRTGRSYEGFWACDACRPPRKPAPRVPSSGGTSNGSNTHKTMLMAYAKDLIIARMQHDEMFIEANKTGKVQIDYAVTSTYFKLLEAYNDMGL